MALPQHEDLKPEGPRTAAPPVELDASPPRYKVLLVTNLWPTADDPSYGSAIQAQMESLRPLGVDYDVVFLNGRQSLMNYVKGIFEVRWRVAGKPYDLIHAEFGLSGWVARCQRRVPVVVKFMGDDVLGRFDGAGRLTLLGRIFQLSSFILARSVDAVIVMSEPMKRKLRLPSARVIPTGIDLELFRPLDRDRACRALNLDPRKKYALFPYGSDRPAKRLDLVQAAVRLARAQFPELEVLQVSGIPRQQMPFYYNAADVLVLASESEGSPNSVKEALAVNLPVISVEVGDTAEVLRGVEGNYIVPRTAEAIAAPLIEVCRRGGRSRGRERAQQFSLRDRSQKVLEVYRSVTRERREARAPAASEANAAALVAAVRGATEPPPALSSERILERCERLHAYLFEHHIFEGLLKGPDPGVRFNWRFWRFLKSALDFVPWGDDYVFMQAQGNWALANWLLFDATGQPRYRDIALETAEAVLALEISDGYWHYPLPERRHLIAALEGIWGATVLLSAYSRTGRTEFSRAAVRAYDFIVSHIGFQSHDGGEVINYFDRPRGKVPNNSVIAVWFFLRLWRATEDHRFMEHIAPMLRFIAAVQMPSGEIPYIVSSPYESARDHYLCFQYNAHMFLHLGRAEALRPGLGARPILDRLFQFLRRGVQPSGACANDCASAGRGGPEVNYYTAALGAALHSGYRLGLSADDVLAERCFSRLLARQRPNGGFGFSTGDYGLLNDERSYPRQQAAILFHLLTACDHGDGFTTPPASV